MFWNMLNPFHGYLVGLLLYIWYTIQQVCSLCWQKSLFFEQTCYWLFVICHRYFINHSFWWVPTFVWPFKTCAHLVNGSLVGVPFVETLVSRLTIITWAHPQWKGRISTCKCACGTIEHLEMPIKAGWKWNFRPIENKKSTCLRELLSCGLLVSSRQVGWGCWGSGWWLLRWWRCP